MTSSDPVTKVSSGKGLKNPTPASGASETAGVHPITVAIRSKKSMFFMLVVLKITV
jgi:hypothetical protein